MRTLAFILSLLTVTQFTFAFVTGVGQGDQDVGLRTDDVTTVPMTTGYAFATDVAKEAFSDAIDVSSTPLIMQTNNEDRESSGSPEYGTEPSTLPSEVVEQGDGEVVEQLLEAVTNDSPLVTEEHESTDSSSSEMDTNATTLEGDVQLTTEGVDGNATTDLESDKPTGESDQPESQLEAEGGTKKPDEEGQEGETEGKGEEILTSQANDGEDQLLTTLALETESTGKSETQATGKEAFSSTVEPGYQDDHSKISSSEVPSSQAATFSPEMEETVTIEEGGNIESVASDLVVVEHKLQSDEVRKSDSEVTSATLPFEPEQPATTDSTVDGSAVKEEPISEVPSSEAATFSPEMEETVTIEEGGNTESAVSDLVDVEHKLQSDEVHESDSEMTSEALPFEPEQLTTTDSTADGSTVEVVPTDVEEIMEKEVESFGTEEVIAETTTETTTTTMDSRVATVKTHATIPNKVVQRGAFWFQSLRKDIVQSLHGVKNSIYQAADSLQKAVEELKDVMLSFVDSIKVHPRKGTSFYLLGDEPMEVRETVFGTAEEE